MAVELEKVPYPEHTEQLAICVEADVTEREARFLDLVKAGDRERIKEFLQDEEEFDVNCCDYRGETALEIAVGAHDINFVEFLLSEIKVNSIHYYCAVLRAVLDDDLTILKILLDRCENDEKMHTELQSLIGGGEMCSKHLQDVSASDLTPLMAAAIRGNMETTRTLLHRGYHIEKPHYPKCTCSDICKQRSLEGETLTRSMLRINTYRAIASPTYLVLTSDDPVLTAFELSVELKYLASQLPETTQEYEKLADQCSTFATDLLHQCRTTEEVKIILQQKKGFPDLGHHRFRRLKLAIRHEQKKFVSHASCQQVLRSLQMEGLPSWQTWNTQRKVLHCLQHSLLTLPVCAAYIFVPRASLISSLKVPFNRFIYYTTSYAIFLSVLIFTLLTDRNTVERAPTSSKTSSTAAEIIVILWILGFTLDLFFQYRCVTVNRNPLSWLKAHAFDTMMVILFMTAQSITMVDIIQADIPGTHQSVTVGYALYATASVIAFGRLLHWCHINSHLGPLIVSLKYMIGDILRFFIIFFIVISSFAIGLNSIYKRYDSAKNKDAEAEAANPAFTSLGYSLLNLFWAIFGKGENNYVSITVKNSTQTTLFTEVTGYFLWGLYHWVTTLVLLNMLIGMMAESYQRVLKDADTEWKFGLTTFWQRFLDCSCMVPPPFNLIPSVPCGMYYYKFTKKMSDGTLQEEDSDFFGAFLSSTFQGMSEIEEKHNEGDYERLLVKLIRRYVHSVSLSPAGGTQFTGHENSANQGSPFLLAPRV